MHQGAVQQGGAVHKVKIDGPVHVKVEVYEQCSTVDVKGRCRLLRDQTGHRVGQYMHSVLDKCRVPGVRCPHVIFLDQWEDRVIEGEVSLAEMASHLQCGSF